MDAALQGGLPRYSAVIISGLPGTGKTILSPQAAFANARAGRTCLYLTTLAEPPLKMLRFLQGFTFFQPDLVATKVRYGDLGAVLRTDGPADVLAQVVGLLREHRPELVVIDSFIFKAKQARAIYDALDIEKCEIEKGQAWPNYIETMFSVMHRMADHDYAQATTWQEMRACLPCSPA